MILVTKATLPTKLWLQCFIISVSSVMLSYCYWQQLTFLTHTISHHSLLLDFMLLLIYSRNRRRFLILSARYMSPGATDTGSVRPAAFSRPFIYLSKRKNLVQVFCQNQCHINRLILVLSCAELEANEKHCDVTIETEPLLQNKLSYMLL